MRISKSITQKYMLKSLSMTQRNPEHWNKLEEGNSSRYNRARKMVELQVVAEYCSDRNAKSVSMEKAI